jgi:hypothetical protein
MEDKASRVFYFLLFIFGWIGVIWSVYAFCVNAYNNTMNVFTDNPSYFILLCVSLISIAAADFMFEQRKQAKP